jgi:hypothetical protein
VHDAVTCRACLAAAAAAAAGEVADGENAVQPDTDSRQPSSGLPLRSTHEHSQAALAEQVSAGSMDQQAVGWLQGLRLAAGSTQHPAESRFLTGGQLPAVPASAVTELPWHGSSCSSNPTNWPSVPQQQQQQQQVRRVLFFAVGTDSLLTVCKRSTVLVPQQCCSGDLLCASVRLHNWTCTAAEHLPSQSCVHCFHYAREE